MSELFSLPVRKLDIITGRNYMLRWALIFLVLAVVAAILGFGGVADIAVNIAYVLGIIFLILLVVHIVTGRTRA